MKPYANDAATEAAWEPLMMGMMDEPHDPADPQVMETCSTCRKARRWWMAAARGVDATGWSWSGKFGDLDQDGFVDLLRSQRHDGGCHLCPPAQPRTGGGEPGLPQRRRWPLSPRPRMAIELNPAAAAA
ncbi:MAG: hypothetical protein R2911_36265 [Caldilineaceae bacterium]